MQTHDIEIYLNYVKELSVGERFGLWSSVYANS